MSSALPKQFFAVFCENTAFLRKNCWIKKFQHQISDIKSYIHSWCKMNPDRSHSDTVGRVANKVFAPFNPYFYFPKYPSSDALPAPEILKVYCMDKWDFGPFICIFKNFWWYHWIPWWKLVKHSEDNKKGLNMCHTAYIFNDRFVTAYLGLLKRIFLIFKGERKSCFQTYFIHFKVYKFEL